MSKENRFMVLKASVEKRDSEKANAEALAAKKA